MRTRPLLLEKPPVAVRVGSALAHAIAEHRPTRLDDRASTGHRHDRDHIGTFHGIVAETVMYRRLAMRVIQRAFEDMIAPACAAGDRESARRFLAGSSMLFHWCSVASLDPRRVMACATTLRSRQALPR